MFNPEAGLESKEKYMEIPPEVKAVDGNLKTAGFEAYLVGGCVRDFLLDKKPKDWDLTTNAAPEKMLQVFSDAFYENKFGTVAVKTGSEDPSLAIVEVTTYRLESKYTDKRHPDEIKFAQTVEEDLARRDFTMNAIAMGPASQELVDPYGGKKDLDQKIIRAVGEPTERFQEDALRLMRAVRFAAQLGFDIEKKTAAAVKENAGLLEFIAKERVAEELNKLLMTENAAEGIRQMEKLGLLKYVMPELRDGINMEQNKHHIYTVFEHNLRALDYAVKQNFPLVLRWASLLHDVGKPQTREWQPKENSPKIHQGVRGDWSFYQHQYAGEKIAVQMLDRLHFPKKMTEKVALMVREHMFMHDPDIATQRGVRRLVRRVGADNTDDLLLVREADRIGSGVEKAVPYRMRHLKAMIEKAKQEPIHPKMLAVKGDDVMRELKIQPGPKIGWVLGVLLDKVLDDPQLNNKDTLMDWVKKLGALSDQELQKLAEESKEKIEDVQKRIDEEIKRKYFVR